MAHNKSIKNTPSSRSGYLPELTNSHGKQSNFLLPVRIKVTPTHTCPLSDGKKHPSKMFQPVLIKDLLSSHKDKNSSAVTSASTQKKKARPQRSTQPYLNTQSCYKPKVEGEESFSLSRKSFGDCKVRRQLYQTLDSPQNYANKENSSRNIKPKKRNTQAYEEPESKSSQAQSKNRKSLLLPPNSIKNSFMSKSGTNLKAAGKQTGRNTVSNVNRQTKGTSRAADTRNTKSIVRKSVFGKTDDYEEAESNCSTPDSGDQLYSLPAKQDNCTMTSPGLGRDTFSSKSNSDFRTIERPSVIMSPSKRSASQYLNNTDLPYLEMQNLNINQASQSFLRKDQLYPQNFQGTEFMFNRLDSNNLIQFKFYLEQSIQACETQVLNLKQVLSFVNTMLNNDTPAPCVQSNKSPEADEKINVSNKFSIYQDDESDATDIVEKSVEMKSLSFEADTLAIEENTVRSKEPENSIAQDKLTSLPIKIVVSDVDLKETKELSMDLNEMARLSTIGEVSCEADESNKYEYENKENHNNSQVVTPPKTPKTPKTPNRKSNCDSASRRRSARLAAKRMSNSELDSNDSFTMLENELNMGRPVLSSKSLPASPMKPPMTPGVIRQWDKKVERPLKEYMALKMNGTFLVTPDVKRFQSCLDFEPTDTPHSRKSLSRKIFMELCDLYAESPESK